MTDLNYLNIGKQPGRLQVVARAKYDAWKAVGTSMSKEEAKMAFIELLKSK